MSLQHHVKMRTEFTSLSSAAASLCLVLSECSVTHWMKEQKAWNTPHPMTLSIFQSIVLQSWISTLSQAGTSAWYSCLLLYPVMYFKMVGVSKHCFLHESFVLQPKPELHLATQHPLPLSPGPSVGPLWFREKGMFLHRTHTQDLVCQLIYRRGKMVSLRILLAECTGFEAAQN